MLQSVYLTLFHQYSVYLSVFIFLLFFPFHILYSICVSWKCRRTSSPWQTVGYLLVNVSLATVNRFQQIVLKHSTLKKVTVDSSKTNLKIMHISSAYIIHWNIIPQLDFKKINKQKTFLFLHFQHSNTGVIDLD